MNTTIKLKVLKDFEQKHLRSKISSKNAYVSLKHKTGDIINTRNINQYLPLINQGLLKIIDTQY
jgi:hypothetical protein